MSVDVEFNDLGTLYGDKSKQIGVGCNVKGVRCLFQPNCKMIQGAKGQNFWWGEIGMGIVPPLVPKPNDFDVI